MIERIFDIAEEHALVQVRHDCLQVTVDGTVRASVPLPEVAVVVASEPRTTFTQASLAGLAAHDGICVLCDAKHYPVGMVLPLQTHHLQVTRFAQQAQVTQPTKKRLWQTIVKAKIQAQGRCLEQLGRADTRLGALVNEVRSGDPTNVEAQAARRYWPLVFGDPEFRRDRGAEDQNRFLNYGYAVLRAMTARAICAAGLHPSLGVHHHNRSSTFPLADDLMEPFRPLVDIAVARSLSGTRRQGPLDAEAKQLILQPLLGRHLHGRETRTVWEWLMKTAVSLAKVFSRDARNLEIPAL